MKKHNMYVRFLLLFCLMLILSFSFVSALTLSVSRYEPTPAVPGQYVDVWLKMDNVHDVDANDVQLELLNQYPFSLANTESKYDFGKISIGDSVVQKVRYKIDSNAPIGSTALNFKYSPDGGDVWIEDEVYIDVKDSSKTLLSVKSVKLATESVSPGSEQTLKLYLENTNSNKLKNLDVKFNLAYSVGVNSVELPFVPVNQASSKYVSEIDSGKTEIVNFDFKVSPDAKLKPYKLPVTISYEDDEGNKFTQNFYVGVLVDAKPDLLAYVDRTKRDPLSSSFVLKFVNRGVDDLKFLTVDLVSSDTLEFLRPSKSIYIGDLNSDDYDTVEIPVKLLNDSVDLQNVKLRVEYSDSSFNNYSEDLSLEFKFDNKLNESSSSPLIYVIIILVLLGVGYFIYRRKKLSNK